MDHLLYHSLSALSIGLISFHSYKYIGKEYRKKSLRYPIALSIWVLLLMGISSTGFYYNQDLPPRFVVFGIVPSFLILSSFSFSKSGNILLKTVPIHLPILFQSFRIFVELLILKTYLDGYTPEIVTFKGYNYEFYFGISALIIGVLYAKNKLSPSVIKIWNYLGLTLLAIIIFLFFSSAFAYESVWNSTIPLVSKEIYEAPYLFIATIYMPLAVWMHIFSIRQIGAKKKR